jgi:spore coat-associated protein N
MKRLRVLAEHPRRSIIALASALAAVAVAIGSGATFTSSSANPSNTFSAGILSQSNSDSNAAILTASNMIPGSSASGTVTITNTGTVNGAFSLSESDITDTPGPNGGKLSGDLQLTVTNVTNSSSPVTVYSGALNAMPTEALGTIAPGSSNAQTYRFTVTMPNNGAPSGPTTGDNAYQGSSTSLQFNWTATT